MFILVYFHIHSRRQQILCWFIYFLSTKINSLTRLHFQTDECDFPEWSFWTSTFSWFVYLQFNSRTKNISAHLNMKSKNPVTKMSESCLCFLLNVSLSASRIFYFKSPVWVTESEDLFHSDRVLGMLSAGVITASAAPVSGVGMQEGEKEKSTNTWSHACHMR